MDAKNGVRCGGPRHIAEILGLDEPTHARIRRIFRLEPSGSRPLLAKVVQSAVEQAERRGRFADINPLAVREIRWSRSGGKQNDAGDAAYWLNDGKRLARRAFSPLCWSIVAHGLLVIVLHLMGVIEPSESKPILVLNADVAEPLDELDPLDASVIEADLPELEAVAPPEANEVEIPDVSVNSAAPLSAVSAASSAVHGPKVSPLSLEGLEGAGFAELLKPRPARRASSTMFFGVKSEGRAVCFMIDSSRSMRGKFDLARAEVLRSVAQLKPKQRFYVLLFDQNVERMRLGASTPTQPVTATDQHKRQMAEWLMAAQMESSCDPIAALDAALGLDADLLFLLTDGELPDALIPMLRERNQVSIDGQVRRKMAINTIGLHSLRGRELLAWIARENGGVYRFVPR